MTEERYYYIMAGCGIACVLAYIYYCRKSNLGLDAFRESIIEEYRAKAVGIDFIPDIVPEDLETE